MDSVALPLPLPRATAAGPVKQPSLSSFCMPHPVTPLLPGQPWREGTACRGCPKGTGLRLCMLRHVAALFLRDPAADALLTSARPADARNVSSTFHPSRRPWLPRACRERLALECQAGTGASRACAQLYVSASFHFPAVLSLKVMLAAPVLEVSAPLLECFSAVEVVPY